MLYPGGRNINRLYIVASFMMNVYTSFYVSQFTAAMDEAGVDLYVEIDDLLKKAEDAIARLWINFISFTQVSRIPNP